MLSFSCLNQTNAAAAEDFFDLSPEQLLNATVISATKTKETVEQSPAAVYVITAEDIARSGVTSIPDALRMAPGVDVAQGTSGSWAINIRGFNSGLANQLLVMIDGRTIYNPLFAGTYWELQNLPLEDIERIEVIRGPGGTLWGANAVNGVINIITKKAQDTQGRLIRAAAGTLEQDSVLGQVGAKTADDAYYRVYAQHENDGPMHSPDGGDAFDSMRDSRTGFRYDQGDNVTVSGDAYVNTTDQLASIPQETPTPSSNYFTLQNDEHISQGANLLAHWKKTYDNGSQLSLQSYYDYTSRDQDVLSDEENILDFDAQYNWRPIGPHQIITGGGYRLTNEDIGNTATLSINPTVSNRSLFNSFIQDKIALVPERWFLTLGTKVEHNDFTGFEIEPSARLQWFPDNRQTFWTSASRAVTTPSPLETNLNENASVYPPDAIAAPSPFHIPYPLEYNLIANHDFESEQLVAYEAGYRNKLTSDVSVDIAAFNNYYTRMAAQQYAGFGAVFSPVIYGQFETELANLTAGQTYGAEMAADWNVNSNWKLSSGVTWLEMSLQSAPGAIAQYLAGQSPNYEGNLRSYWNINKDWSFDTSAYYVDRLVAYDVPAYVRLDTNVGWKIEPGIQLNLVGQNLLQGAHMEYSSAGSLNAAEVPRSYYAKITCRF